jgi:dienelactone hydrolase
MLDIWYPAGRQDGPRAQYIDAAAFEKALGTDGLSKFLGQRASDLVEAGQVQTHAVEGAAFARSLKRCPLLIFSHGMGTITQIHTAEIEDLVSHGYVVAAITHTYDAWLTLFPDGRSVPFERTRRAAAGSSGDQRVAYENTRVEWWANDIRFVLDELTRLDGIHTAAMQFAGHLNLKRVGAFGHSVGGRAAARACQLDRRFRACANQDGLVGGLPFYRDERGWGMDQPFLLIMREDLSPRPEAELRRIGRTREQDEAIVAEHIRQRDAALSATGGGSYRVRLKLLGTSHMSFSDLPLLNASDGAEAATRLRIFNATAVCTRAFFDKTLRGLKAPMLDDGLTTEWLELIQKYPPTHARKEINKRNRGLLTH